MGPGAKVPQWGLGSALIGSLGDKVPQKLKQNGKLVHNGRLEKTSFA